MKKRISFILMIAVLIAIMSNPETKGRISNNVNAAAGRAVNTVLLNKWTVCASVLLVAIVHIAVMAVTALIFGWTAGKILTVNFGKTGFAVALGMYPACFGVMVKILLALKTYASRCQNPALKQLILETVKTWKDGYGCTAKLFEKLNKSKIYTYLVPGIIKLPYNMWLEQLEKLA